MKPCSSKLRFCENKTDNISGICGDCLKQIAKKFWEFVDSHEKSRQSKEINTSSIFTD